MWLQCLARATHRSQSCCGLPNRIGEEPNHVEGAERRASPDGERLSAEDKIARALGVLVVRGIEERQDQVRLLRSIGFDNSEVAALLGITKNSAAVAAHRGSRKRSRKKRKRTD